jgi:UDPglucose--hexose-1-phosphate uridylyltransferase
MMETKDRKGKWQVRLVPNKFPALSPEVSPERDQEGIYITMPGYGHHEVIIESPRHDRQIGWMSKREIQMIVETYHRRYRELMREDENMMVIIFRNHGERAGTSLIHPHSQLIATGMVPYHVRWREEEAQRYFDKWGRCVYCDILKNELREERRVVYENDTFVAFVPFAADVPFEVQIMPREHKADFGDISAREKSGLAGALKAILSMFVEKLGDPDYNYIFNTSAQYRAREPQLHWYLSIRPRLMTRAGFEIGSGISINPSTPEADAAYLKGLS